MDSHLAGRRIDISIGFFDEHDDVAGCYELLEGGRSYRNEMLRGRKEQVRKRKPSREVRLKEKDDRSLTRFHAATRYACDLAHALLYSSAG